MLDSYIPGGRLSRLTPCGADRSVAYNTWLIELRSIGQLNWFSRELLQLTVNEWNGLWSLVTDTPDQWRVVNSDLQVKCLVPSVFRNVFVSEPYSNTAKDKVNCGGNNKQLWDSYRKHLNHARRPRAPNCIYIRELTSMTACQSVSACSVAGRQAKFSWRAIWLLHAVLGGRGNWVQKLQREVNYVPKKWGFETKSFVFLDQIE